MFIIYMFFFRHAHDCSCFMMMVIRSCSVNDCFFFLFCFDLFQCVTSFLFLLFYPYLFYYLKLYLAVISSSVSLSLLFCIVPLQYIHYTIQALPPIIKKIYLNDGVVYMCMCICTYMYLYTFSFYIVFCFAVLFPHLIWCCGFVCAYVECDYYHCNCVY